MATPVEVIARCSNANSFVSMLGGCGFGLLLGNSSATELILAPFVGMGVIDIEQVNENCCESAYYCIHVKPYIYTYFIFYIFPMLLSISADVSLESGFKCRIISHYYNLSHIYWE